MQQICRRFLPLLLCRLVLLATPPAAFSALSAPPPGFPDSWHICISNGEWRRVPGKLGGFGFTCSSPALTAKCALLRAPFSQHPCFALSRPTPPFPFYPHVWQHACEVNLTFSFSGVSSLVAIKLLQLLMALPKQLTSFHFRLRCG